MSGQIQLAAVVAQPVMAASACVSNPPALQAFPDLMALVSGDSTAQQASADSTSPPSPAGFTGKLPQLLQKPAPKKLPAREHPGLDPAQQALGIEASLSQQAPLPALAAADAGPANLIPALAPLTKVDGEETLGKFTAITNPGAAVSGRLSLYPASQMSDEEFWDSTTTGYMHAVRPQSSQTPVLFKSAPSQTTELEEASPNPAAAPAANSSSAVPQGVQYLGSASSANLGGNFYPSAIASGTPDLPSTATNATNKDSPDFSSEVQGSQSTAGASRNLELLSLDFSQPSTSQSDAGSSGGAAAPKFSDVAVNTEYGQGHSAAAVPTSPLDNTECADPAILDGVQDPIPSLQPFAKIAAAVLTSPTANSLEISPAAPVVHPGAVAITGKPAANPLSAIPNIQPAPAESLHVKTQGRMGENGVTSPKNHVPEPQLRVVQPNSAAAINSSANSARDLATDSGKKSLTQPAATDSTPSQTAHRTADPGGAAAQVTPEQRVAAPSVPVTPAKSDANHSSADSSLPVQSPAVAGAQSSAGNSTLAASTGDTHSGEPRSGDPSAASQSLSPTQVQAARIFQGGSQLEMRVGLRTDAFGAVQVHATVSNKGVDLALGSERGDLRASFTSELPSLQATLQQHDLRLEQVRTLAQVPQGQQDFNSSGGGEHRAFRRPESHTLSPRDALRFDDDEAVPSSATGLSVRA